LAKPHHVARSVEKVPYNYTCQSSWYYPGYYCYGQTTMEGITGGSPYGSATIAGGDGSRLPTANELQGAGYQGRKIAETANKLHG
jgi:multimeric flavodoxin WrbA